LNEVREKLEQIVNILHMPDGGALEKLRTYRKEACKAYLSIEKQRKE
jgi:hypothetical protein